MHKRISIFRTKPKNDASHYKSDMVFTTGENLKHILDSIKPYAENCTIYLHECENMIHFRAMLKDNFPKAIIRHCGVALDRI